MLRYKLLLLIFLFISFDAQAQRSKVRPARSKWSLALGDLNWSEPIKLTQDGIEDAGTVNYNGLLLGIDGSLRWRRWVFGSGLGLATGKATAGLYSGDLTFEDGKNRSWLGAFAQPYASYSIHRMLTLGAGAILLYRNGDWTPADSSLRVSLKSALQIGPQVTLRVDVWPQLSLVQTLASLGNDHTLWSFRIQWNFRR